jgi:hypothetical protein
MALLLFSDSHPTVAGTFSKIRLSTAADLNETSLEQSMIDIAAMTDERGLRVAARGVKMIIPSELQFTAERLMKSQGRTGTADNDINAIVSMGMVPQGYRVNNYLTDDRCVLYLDRRAKRHENVQQSSIDNCNGR